MHILVIGAAGMIGRKLVERLLREKKLGGKAISKLSLQDVVAPAEPREKPLEIATRTGDLSVPGEAAALVAGNPDVIFHLAAIVSGEAETDLEKGYRINLDGTRFLFDAIRARGRLVVLESELGDALQAEALLVAGDLTRDADVIDGRHVNQEAARQGDVRSDARAFFRDWLFGNLDQNFLAFLQQVADGRHLPR